MRSPVCCSYSTKAMKARTDEERHVEGLRGKLKPLTPAQRHEAESAWGQVVASKSGGWCLGCGGQWSDESLAEKSGKKAVCPHCGKSLKVIIDSHKRKQVDRYYYIRLDLVGGYNVQRSFYVQRQRFRTIPFYGQSVIDGKDSVFIDEVFQIWISPKGERFVFAKMVNMSNLYNDLWRFESDMTLKPWHHRYGVGGFLGKGYHLMPEVRMRGLTRINDEYSVYGQIVDVLKNPTSEILLKRGYRDLFLARLDYDSKLRFVPWDALNVATRHKYRFGDIGLWCDYVDDLKELGLDLHSPHYLCPQDLGEAHIRMQARKAKKSSTKQDLERADKDNADYLSKIAPYSSLRFASGSLTIRPIMSVREVLDEGNHLCHCVFRNACYKGRDNLLMTARVDNKRVETVEVSVESFRILQSRGYANRPTPYHKKIEQLVNRNMDRIRKCAMSAKQGCVNFT